MAKIETESVVESVLAIPQVDCLPNGGVKILLHGIGNQDMVVVCSGDILSMKSLYFRELLEEWNGEHAVEDVIACDVQEAAHFLQYLHCTGKSKLAWNRDWAKLSVKWIVPDIQTAYCDMIQQALRATAPLEVGDRVRVDEHVVRAEFGRATIGSVLKNCNYLGEVVGWESIGGHQQYAVVQLEGNWQVSCYALKVAGQQCVPGNVSYILQRRPRCQAPLIDLGAFPTFCVDPKHLTRVVLAPFPSFAEHWWEMAQTAIKYSHFRAPDQTSDDVVDLMLTVFEKYRRQVWDKSVAGRLDAAILAEMLDRVL